MVSRTVHSVLFLENTGLKFDLSGVKRQRKHGIFTNWKFYHISNELREHSSKSFEDCKMLLPAFEYTHPLHFEGVSFQDLQHTVKNQLFEYHV